MAKKGTYKIAMDEGADFATFRLGFRPDVGTEHELHLDSADQERDLIAAGLLEHPDKGKKEKS